MEVNLENLELIAEGPVDPARGLLAIEAAWSLTRAYCGWHITPERRETVVVDAIGGRITTLPTLNLGSIHTTDIRHGDETWSPVAVRDWSAGGWIVGCWPDRPRALRVDMTHGYAEPPDGIPVVVLNLAAASLTAPVAVSSEQAGGESVSYNTAGGEVPHMLSAQMLAILDAYRIPRRP